MPEMVGDWRRLWGISAYRLLIAAVIAVLLHLPASETIIDLGGHARLLRVLALVAATVSLGYLLALLLRRPVQPRRHAWIQVSTDTLLVLLLLHFGGGGQWSLQYPSLPVAGVHGEPFARQKCFCFCVDITCTAGW